MIIPQENVIKLIDMKKLLGIVVLGLLLSGNAYADLFGFSKKLQKISPGDSPSAVEKKTW